MEEQLEFLDTFAFRVHDTAVSMIESLIRRLKIIKLTYPDEWSRTGLEPERYQNADTLTIRAIDILTQLRYLETDRVLRFLLELSAHNNDNIRKKAIARLEALATYNLTVFYGPEQKGGIGAAPQKEVIDHIESLDDATLGRYREGIVAIAEGLLSPTMEATSATYKTVTWTRAAVPAHSDVIEIRQRTVALLKRLYSLAVTASDKAQIIRALVGATRSHSTAALDEDTHQMLVRNSVEVLRYFEQLVGREDLPLIQRIEHESYWIFHRAFDEEVKSAAQRVESAVAANAEYHIYKQLVGFEGIFGKWSSLEARAKRWRATDKYRQRKASQYARSITPENYEEWRQRILRYAQTESDDLATFPVFYRFLNEFAESNPESALSLVSTDSERLQPFLIPLLRGLWASRERTIVRDVIKGWIVQRKHLNQCTKMFMGNDDPDRDLLILILQTGKQIGDREVLTLIVSVAVSNYSDRKRFLLADFMVPAIEELTKHCDSRWVHDSWYRREFRAVMSALDESELDVIFANLSHLKEIDYHTDDVLALVAERFPEKVLNFFGERLKAYHQWQNLDGSVFDALPFELHKLKHPLSKIPDETVRIVRTWYTGNYGMFVYEGARLLKNIFPDFPEQFQSELLKLVRAGSEENMKFVLAILQNYEGQTFIHPLCKEIVRALPRNSSLLTEVMIALETTGVVVGEFGFAEAYERKANEMSDWLNDTDEKVSGFAKKYIENLRRRSDAERKRAKEEIELRKYRFGE